MAAPSQAAETLVDMLARAIAEVDDGNLSAAARKLGVSRPTLYSWLRGSQPRRNAHLEAIATYTGEEIDDVQRATYASGVAYTLPEGLGGYLLLDVA